MNPSYLVHARTCHHVEHGELHKHVLFECVCANSNQHASYPTRSGPSRDQDAVAFPTATCSRSTLDLE